MTNPKLENNTITFTVPKEGIYSLNAQMKLNLVDRTTGEPIQLSPQEGNFNLFNMVDSISINDSPPVKIMPSSSNIGTLYTKLNDKKTN